MEDRARKGEESTNVDTMDAGNYTFRVSQGVGVVFLANSFREEQKVTD